MRKIPPKQLSCVLSISTLFVLAGCNNVRNVTVTVSGGKYVTGTTVPQSTPITGAIVSGQWQYDISDKNQLGGSVYSFDQTTDSTGIFTVNNVRMPAEWSVEWHNDPTFCVDQDDITQDLTVPLIKPYDFEPTIAGANFVPLMCYVNDPTHPNFTYTNVSPQFALDDALPSSLWVASLDQIPSGGTTSLNVYDSSLNNVATMTSSSITGSGTGANFPYPRIQSSSLSAGAYITTITNQIGTAAVTTHGMEPFYIAHDDTSFPGAYGVAVASPKKNVDILTWTRGEHNVCFPGAETNMVTGGTTLPLVTLLNSSELAIGTSSRVVTVGTHPTVVIPFNDSPQTVTTQAAGCPTTTTTIYSGAESALVVNTGSNTVSIVQIGSYIYPSGTVSVGNSPVAAAINSAETFAYIANYVDGTISEVNLSTIQLTRTLSVMTHPTSLAFDQSGNLWVGGQGYLAEVAVSSWTVTSSIPVDGTVNGMSYDATSGVLVESLLQNGSISNRSNGHTLNALVSFSPNTSASYSTQSNYNISTGTSTPSAAFGDNSSYSQSAASSSLAYPAETAFTPPVYTSSNGEITATATGTSFTVSVVNTGQVLLQGTLPHPARGVALVSNMVYFTMPDTNSLVSLPIQIP